MNGTLNPNEHFASALPVWDWEQETAFFDAIEGQITKKLQTTPLTREEERVLYRTFYQTGLKMILNSLEIRVIND